MTITFVAPHSLHARSLVVPRGRDLIVWNRTPDLNAAVHSPTVRSDAAESSGVPVSALGETVVRRLRQSSVMQAEMTTSERLAEPGGRVLGLQAQQAEVSALGETGAMIAQLQQLGQLREAGLLSEEEFSAAKAKLLAG